MGVTVREKIKDSGDFFIFINWNGYRKSKKIGRDLRLANEVAEKIKARLVLGERPFEPEESQRLPTFEKYSRQWLKLPTDRKLTTIEVYERSLEHHVFPEIGKMPIDEIKKPRLQALFDYLAVDGYSKSPLVIEELRKLRTEQKRRALKGGHADVKITVKTYGHLKHDDFQDEIDSLDALHLNAPQAQPINIKCNAFSVSVS